MQPLEMGASGELEGDSAEARRRALGNGEAGEVRLSGDTISVLLVDDDPDDLLLTDKALRASLRCCVHSASTGGQALAMLYSADYHVVLLDNTLPDMPGLDVLSRMRESSCQVPVILVTGTGREATVVEAMRRGASDYVVKTGDHLRVIPEVVAQVIERDRVRRRAEHLELEHLRFARLAAIGEVAAGIAHEIRNPMTVIAGMASLLRDSHGALSSEEIEKCAQAIVDNCAHLTQVLEEVLQGARHTQSRELLVLREVVTETLSFMRFDRDWRHHMEVHADFGCDGYVLGNRDELKQVFINLFRNAAQAVRLAGKRNGTITITLREQPSKSEILVSICDDGVGIAAEVLPHIFESGFSTKRRGTQVQGTGLGLSICRRIIEAHAGRLWAQNNAEGGATFYLTVPYAPVQGGAESGAGVEPGGAVAGDSDSGIGEASSAAEAEIAEGVAFKSENF